MTRSRRSGSRSSMKITNTMTSAAVLTGLMQRRRRNSPSARIGVGGGGSTTCTSDTFGVVAVDRRHAPEARARSAPSASVVSETFRLCSSAGEIGEIRAQLATVTRQLLDEIGELVEHDPQQRARDQRSSASRRTITASTRLTCHLCSRSTIGASRKVSRMARASGTKTSCA